MPTATANAAAISHSASIAPPPNRASSKRPLETMISSSSTGTNKTATPPFHGGRNSTGRSYSTSPKDFSCWTFSSDDETNNDDDNVDRPAEDEDSASQSCRGCRETDQPPEATAITTSEDKAIASQSCQGRKEIDRETEPTTSEDEALANQSCHGPRETDREAKPTAITTSGSDCSASQAFSPCRMAPSKSSESFDLGAPPSDSRLLGLAPKPNSQIAIPRDLLDLSQDSPPPMKAPRPRTKTPSLKSPLWESSLNSEEDDDGDGDGDDDDDDLAELAALTKGFRNSKNTSNFKFTNCAARPLGAMKPRERQQEDTTISAKSPQSSPRGVANTANNYDVETLTAGQGKENKRLFSPESTPRRHSGKKPNARSRLSLDSFGDSTVEFTSPASTPGHSETSLSLGSTESSKRGKKSTKSGASSSKKDVSIVFIDSSDDDDDDSGGPAAKDTTWEIIDIDQ